MKLNDYILLEEYQDLYTFKSIFRTKETLQSGYLIKSQGGPFKEIEPHICVTRDINYQKNNCIEKNNVGSIQEMPGNFAAIFVLDAEKIRQRYKIKPYLTPRFKGRDIPAKLRYEAEERIVAEKISIKQYVKKLIISSKTNLKSLNEIKEMAKKYDIPVEVGDI